MKKTIKKSKRLLTLFLSLLLCFNSFAAIVSDNDGSAFVTKAEFEAMKKDFADQVDNYNSSIDAKIDGAIAAYLAGFKVASKYALKSILNSINSIGYNYSSAAGFPFSNGNITITGVQQQPQVFINGTFTYQNLTEVSGNWGTAHHCGAGRANYEAKAGAGTAWRVVEMYGVKCLDSYMNLRQRLSFSIADSPALHDSGSFALAHDFATSSDHYLNRNTNMDTEIVKSSDTYGGRWLKRTSVGSASYTATGLSSGRGVTTLSKGIVNSINNKTKGWFAPIGPISQTGGHYYLSDTDLFSSLTKTNPYGGTATDNVKVTFDRGLFWHCTNGPDGNGTNCPWGTGDTGKQAPVKTGAYEHLYWNRQYFSTTAFNLVDMYAYGPTAGYGEGIKYYEGLPICKNDYGSGTLTFSLQPVAVGSGTVANKVQLCFRTQRFANMNPANDSSNNMKNIYYKARSATTWTKCNNAGGVGNLAPGTTYDFKIEDFPQDTELWVKPYTVQNTSSTSTTVYAYLKTIGNIIIEVS